MRKINGLFIVLLTFSFLFLTRNSYSKTWGVNVSNFQFSPASINNVIVGDTIKWQWLSGTHTTTSLSVPTGAAMWDEPITESNQIYRYVVTVAGTYDYKCTPHFPNMVGSFIASPVGITSQEGKLPRSFKLFQNYPNPFNPVTDIKFEIPGVSFVKLTVYDLLGNEVEVLVKQQLQAGSYVVDWQASNYTSGIYFYKLEAGNYSATMKMTLIK